MKLSLTMTLGLLAMSTACFVPDDVSSPNPWGLGEEGPGVADRPEVPPEMPREPLVTPREDLPGQACLREPASHRPASAACDAERPPGGAIPPFTGEESCTHDDDCTEGDNGRCTAMRWGLTCTYDACFVDDDCGDAGVCACEGHPRSDANRCVDQGNCRTDADCGETGFCSPSFGSCGDLGGVVGYFCHTCADECSDDADCAEGGQQCIYNQSAGRWRCEYTVCDG